MNIWKKVVVVAVLVAVAVPAFADMSCWFPWVRSANRTVGHAIWGGPSDSIYLNWSGNDSAIWPASEVFYNGTPESWYDISPGNCDFMLEISNQQGVNFTGASRLQIYVYDGSGALADETTKWHVYEGTETAALINTSPGAPLTWDSTNNCFLLELNAGCTTVISGFWGSYNMFTSPPDETFFKPSIKVRQPGGYDFGANIRVQAQYDGWRTSTGISGSSFGKSGLTDLLPDVGKSLIYSYGGFFECDYNPEDSNTVQLPYFREKRQNSLSSFEWTTLCFVTNTLDVSDTVTIYVKALDGTNVATKTVTLAAHQTYSFSPHQAYTSSTNKDESGQILVLGTRPAAVSANFKMCETSTTLYSKRTRSVDSGCLPFSIWKW